MRYKLIPFSTNSSNGISFEIYLSGCNRAPRCKGCHNPEFHSFKEGTPLTLGQLGKHITTRLDKFDNFVIMGGEPLDQDYCDLMDLLTYLRRFKKQIWLYTSYEFDEVKCKGFHNMVEYVKTGRYDESLLTSDNLQYGVKLASSNQQIHKI